jgi:hypothetical protein
MAIRNIDVVGCGLMGIQRIQRPAVCAAASPAPDGAFRDVWQEKWQGLLRLSITKKREPRMRLPPHISHFCREFMAPFALRLLFALESLPAPDHGQLVLLLLKEAHLRH